METYGSGLFTPKYPKAEGANGKMRLVPDTGRERSSNVLAACDRMIGRGKEISIDDHCAR